MDELRYAFRRLRAQPGLTVASLLTLGCAVGAAVTVWSVVDAVLIHPLGVAESDRLVAVGTRTVSGSSRVATGLLNTANFYPDYETVAASGVFEHVSGGGFSTQPVTIDGVTTNRAIFFASHNFFDVLGIRLHVGRGFTPTDDRRGTGPVAILAHSFWRSEFRSDPGVIGRTLIIGSQTVAIVGVAPEGFRGIALSRAPELYLPLQTIIETTGVTGWFADPALTTASQWMWIVGRLRSNQAEPAAEAALSAAIPRLGRVVSFGLTKLDRATLPAQVRPDMVRFARLLGVAVGVLLVIGCMTAATPLVLRNEARREEFAVRLALGATRRTFAAGLFWESALLSIGGALIALPVSAWLLGAVRAFQLPGRIDIGGLELSVDRESLSAAVLLVLLGTLLVAAVAVAFGSFAHTENALRARAGGTPPVGRRMMRAGLATAQVAVALVLLSGAGLLTRSLVAALKLNPGYDTRHVVTGRVVLLPAYGFAKERATSFFVELEDRLKDRPTIQSVSLALPDQTITPRAVLVVKGQRISAPSPISRSYVDDRYFRTMGLDISAGRNFTPDDHATSPHVAIVSASLGKLLSPDGRPVGVELTTDDTFEVVGVVPDVVTRVADPLPLVLYTPAAQWEDFNNLPHRAVLLRPKGSAPSAIKDAIATLKHMAPTMPPPLFMTIDDQLSRQMGPQRFGAAILGVLGLIVLLLTIVSVYVLAESMFTSHRQELAIRRVLGASMLELSAHILRDTIRSVLAGIGIGLVMAWLGSGLMKAFLFGVRPTDVLTLGGVSGAMLVLAIAASIKSVLRVSRLNLASTLREL